MKKFVIHTPNKRILKLVLDQLEKSNYNLEDRSLYEILKYDKNHCIDFTSDPKLVMYSGIDYYIREGYDIINAEVFLKICGADQINTVSLNDEYHAEIDHAAKSIKVGCQSFTFEAIENLYKAIKEES